MSDADPQYAALMLGIEAAEVEEMVVMVVKGERRCYNKSDVKY